MAGPRRSAAPAGERRMSGGFLPYGRQTIEADDIEAVAAALRDDYLTTGPRVATFEAAFAEAVGAPPALACNSGTAALLLAAMALGLGAADAVLVATLTFLATAPAARSDERRVGNECVERV